MTPAGKLLQAEILRSGPVSFRRFMEIALYHAEHGYYRRGRDPFGKGGDYYTAEQLQPVFGILVAATTTRLWRQMGCPEDFTVVELGAGRREMAAAFSQWRYVPLEAGAGVLPDRFRGLVFANEFFDALPVHAVIRRGDGFREMLVDARDDAFVWTEGGEAAGEVRSHLERFGAPREQGDRLEVNLDARYWLREVAHRIEEGFVLAIDYGYTKAEIARFPAGTLMSYRRHAAGDDVLAGPGERDITTHVNFTALEGFGEEAGLRRLRFESLAQLLLAAGEEDQFAAALRGSSEAESLRRRLQLKSLLFGMGETFRALLLGKPVPK